VTADDAADLVDTDNPRLRPLYKPLVLWKGEERRAESLENFDRKHRTWAIVHGMLIKHGIRVVNFDAKRLFASFSPS